MDNFHHKITNIKFCHLHLHHVIMIIRAITVLTHQSHVSQVSRRHPHPPESHQSSRLTGSDSLTHSLTLLLERLVTLKTTSCINVYIFEFLSPIVFSFSTPWPRLLLVLYPFQNKKYKLGTLKADTSSASASLTGVLKWCFPQASSNIQACCVNLHIAPEINPL